MDKEPEDRPSGYELSWTQPRTAFQELPYRRNDAVPITATHLSPDNLKAFVAAERSRLGTFLTISAPVDADGTRQTITCGPDEVAAWNPSLNVLPAGRAVPPPPPSRANAGTRMLQSLRNALDIGVKEEALSRTEADAILVAISDLTARARRRAGRAIKAHPLDPDDLLG